MSGKPSRAPSDKMPKQKTNTRQGRHDVESWYNVQEEDQDTTTRSNGSQRDVISGSSNSQFSLDPLAGNIDTTVEQILALQQGIETLRTAFEERSQDIQNMNLVKEELAELKTQCSEKDKKIESQKTASRELREELNEKEGEVAKELAKLDAEKAALREEKKALAQEAQLMKADQQAQVAQMKRDHDDTLSKLKASMNEEHKARLLEVDDEQKAWRVKYKGQITTLEAEKHKATQDIQELEAKLEAGNRRAKKAKGRYEDLEAAKSEYKKQIVELAEELEKFKTEFSLQRQTDQFYKEQFLQISDMITDISHDFFDTELSTMDITNPSDIRKRLIHKDSCFSSVPISSSDDSRLLRIAHAQRVISSALHKYIWQPFSSDIAAQNSMEVDFLHKIYFEVSRASRADGGSGNSARLWRSLTTKALQFLPKHSMPDDILNAHDRQYPASANDRGVKVADEVIGILAPLLDHEQSTELRIKLLELAQSAITVWAFAEADEPTFTVSRALHRENREEWRSNEFDPPQPDSTADAREGDIVSATHPRIFCLFPKITTEDTVHLDDPAVAVPETICIHAGVGLPEWSSLVIGGKQEQEDIKEALKEAQAKVFTEHNNRRTRNGFRSRSGSIVSNGQLSPSTSWNHGNRTSIEE